MNAQKFTQKSLLAIQQAQDTALSYGQMQIEEIHLLGPEASWYAAYRVLILVVMLMPVSVLLLLKRADARATRQWLMYAYLGMVIVAALLICLLPTQVLVTVSTAVISPSSPVNTRLTVVL